MRRSSLIALIVVFLLPESANAQLMDSLKELSEKLKSTINRAKDKSTDEVKRKTEKDQTIKNNLEEIKDSPIKLQGDPLRLEAVTTNKKDVEISVGVGSGDLAVFSAKNNLYAPIILKLEAFTLSNSALGQKTLILSSRSQTEFTIAVIGGNDFIRKWRYKYTYDIGDIEKTLVNYKYRFPFLKNIPITICQSKDGTISSHLDTIEAIDFCAPIGTSILSAREGVVVTVIQENDECGMSAECQDKSNYINIHHADGSIAQYGHILKNSAAVRLGQRVNIGEKIAEVGATGRVSGPHLHFQVSKIGSGFSKKYIDTKFFDSNDDEIKIQYRSKIILKDKSKSSEASSSVEYSYQNPYFGSTKLTRTTEDSTIFWVEVHENQSSTRVYEEIAADEKYISLKLKNKDLWILIPKMGGLSFVTTDNGATISPQNKVTLIRSDSMLDDQTDLIESYSFRTGSFRKYQVKNKTIWVESSFGMLSTFFFYDELKKDGKGLHIIDKKNDRYLVIDKSKGLVFFSTDSGKLLRTYEKITDNKKKVNSTLLDIHLANKPCDDIEGDALTKANACYLARDFEKVSSILNDFFQKNKNNGKAFALAGAALSNLSQHADALMMFDRADANNWVSADAYAIRANSLESLERVEEAIK